jgi:hypothetical protein
MGVRIGGDVTIANATLMTAGILACCLAARRASRVDLSVALRDL